MKGRAKGVIGFGETSGVDPWRGPLSLVKSPALVAGLVPLEGDPAGRRDAALTTCDAGQTVRGRESRTAKGMLDILEAKRQRKRR